MNSFCVHVCLLAGVQLQGVLDDLYFYEGSLGARQTPEGSWSISGVMSLFISHVECLHKVRLWPWDPVGLQACSCQGGWTICTLVRDLWKLATTLKGSWSISL